MTLKTAVFKSMKKQSTKKNGPVGTRPFGREPAL